MLLPAVSLMVACAVCGELGVTLAVDDPFTASVMLAGGQVEKKPAAEVTSDVVAEITVEPGRLAVAVPLGLVMVCVPVTGLGFVGLVVLLIETTSLFTAVYWMVPMFAEGLVQATVVGLHSVTPPGPATVVSASSDCGGVWPWERQLV